MRATVRLCVPIGRGRGSAESPTAMIAISTLILALGVVAVGCATGFQTHDHLWGRVEADPSTYAGKLLAFNGRVLRSSKTKEGWVFQITPRVPPDPYKYLSSSSSELYWETYFTPTYQGSLLVLYPAGGPVVTRGEIISVLGYVGSQVSGRNAFGGVVTSSSMRAIAVQNSSTAWYLEEHADTYRKWASGELFGGR